jgi:hypothetical protein
MSIFRLLQRPQESARIDPGSSPCHGRLKMLLRRSNKSFLVLVLAASNHTPLGSLPQIVLYLNLQTFATVSLVCLLDYLSWHSLFDFPLLTDAPSHLQDLPPILVPAHACLDPSPSQSTLRILALKHPSPQLSPHRAPLPLL